MNPMKPDADDLELDLLAQLLADEGIERTESTIPRLPEGEPAPASFQQERLWLLQQLEPESSAMNMSVGPRRTMCSPLSCRQRISTSPSSTRNTSAPSLTCHL